MCVCVCDVCVRAAAVPAVQRGRHSLLAGKEREEGKIRKEKKKKRKPSSSFPEAAMPRGSLRGARPCRQAAAWPEARGDPARREMAAGPRAGAGGDTE